jgi:hypothetical protein
VQRAFIVDPQATGHACMSCHCCVWMWCVEHHTFQKHNIDIVGYGYHIMPANKENFTEW